jgi:hypothetical protein
MGRRLFFVAILFLCGCSTGKQIAVEQPPTPRAPEPAAAAKPVDVDVARTPRLSEVQDAIKRVFKDAVVLDSDHNPNFVAGDFNGDDSQDLALVLKPVPGKVSELNQEYPPWLLRDLRSSGTVSTFG